ncbi:GntR family transcriptional regulator [Leucobacter allii]|uniref:GntR family transcriptional regulator n=1 Tax=Leucobacter allii TaxID=2932247 RepID=A0ABY4FIY0_9MICO|nr:GntR family transcriptional regulator [Leucobacter allii]UOQ55877.1 GntR family transcriptional regulator [Leucobacter allii]
MREQAVQELRARIVRGDYAAGERVKERELGEELQVSRTVVREALRQLESERLIRIEPQVGPMVAELTDDQARQLYEVRAALEATAARLAATQASDAEISAIYVALGHVSANLEPVDRLLEAKHRFYEALIAASHNAIIGEQLDNVQSRISQLRRVTLSTPNRGPQMLAELRAVVEAIADRDPVRAYDASVAHVVAASRIALGHLTPTALDYLTPPALAGAAPTPAEETP